MSFLVISNFDAELEKIKATMQGTMSNMDYLSTPGQVTLRKMYNVAKSRIHLRNNVCLGYQQVQISNCHYFISF